jgi:hypothetical protein
MLKHSVHASIIFVLIAASQATADDSVEKIVYARDIQPLFQCHCVKCHGEKKAESDLRLDSPDQIKSFGIDRLLTPGKPNDSELYTRVTLGEDDDARMPKGAAPLPAQSIELIKRWIDQGGDLSGTESAPPAEESANKQPHIEVAPAPPAAIEQLKLAHARVSPIYAGSNLLDVSFRYADHPIGNQDLSLLAGVAKQVTWLDLSNQKSNTPDCSILSKLPNLTRLNLSNSNIDDAFLAAIAELEHLDSINLYGTGVSDAGLERLRGMKNLKRVFAAKTNVTYAAASAMEDKNPGLEINIGWDNSEATAARLKKELERVRKAKDDAAFQEAQFRQQKENAEEREKELVDELAKRSAPASQETSAAPPKR